MIYRIPEKFHAVDVHTHINMMPGKDYSALRTADALAMLADGEWRTLENVEIRGVMCMASNTDDESMIAKEFARVQKLFNDVKTEFFAEDDRFNILSAGMSDDYPIAINYGSTHIRVGSKIFND